MKLTFKENQSEEYYRKLLLLDKVKPFLGISQKEYIFNQKYCWDILFKDNDASFLCYRYASNVLEGPFPEGEKAIAKDPSYSCLYTALLNKRFKMAEKTILESSLAPIYKTYLKIFRVNRFLNISSYILFALSYYISFSLCIENLSASKFFLVLSADIIIIWIAYVTQLLEKVKPQLI